MSGPSRVAVCEVPAFRQGVYSDLTAARSDFERALTLSALDEAVTDRVMDTLRLIGDVGKADES